MNPSEFTRQEAEQPAQPGRDKTSTPAAPKAGGISFIRDKYGIVKAGAVLEPEGSGDASYCPNYPITVPAEDPQLAAKIENLQCRVEALEKFMATLPPNKPV